MVSTFPLITKFSCPFMNPLQIVLSVPITNDIIVNLIFHSSLKSLSRSRYLPLFSLSFNFTLWSAGMAKSTLWQVLFYFVDSQLVWSFNWDLMICLYLKIQEKFVCFILQDGFQVVHVSLIFMVKFTVLIQFSVDRLPHIVISILILFLCGNLLHSLIIWSIVSSLTS